MHQVQELLAFHYNKEFEIRDEQFGKIISNNEDIGRLFSTILELEKNKAKIKLVDEDEEIEKWKLITFTNMHLIALNKEVYFQTEASL